MCPKGSELAAGQSGGRGCGVNFKSLHWFSASFLDGRPAGRRRPAAGCHCSSGTKWPLRAACWLVSSRLRGAASGGRTWGGRAGATCSRRASRMRPIACDNWPPLCGREFALLLFCLFCCYTSATRTGTRRKRMAAFHASHQIDTTHEHKAQTVNFASQRVLSCVQLAPNSLDGRARALLLSIKLIHLSAGQAADQRGGKTSESIAPHLLPRFLPHLIPFRFRFFCLLFGSLRLSGRSRSHSERAHLLRPHGPRTLGRISRRAKANRTHNRSKRSEHKRWEFLSRFVCACACVCVILGPNSDCPHVELETRRRS